MPKISPEVRKIVRERDGNRCVFCGEPDKRKGKLQIHHIKYRSRGGSNHPDNLLLVCPRCHREIHEED
jgi:5-methylcytosine-specific restriction endonuclease McrA